MSANNHLMMIGVNYSNYRLSNSLSFKKKRELNYYTFEFNSTKEGLKVTGLDY